MISDIEHDDFPQKSSQKYIRKKPFGPLDGNTRSTTSAHFNPKYLCFQDGGAHRRPFPPDYIVDLEEAATGWVLRLVITIQGRTPLQQTMIH